MKLLFYLTGLVCLILCGVLLAENDREIPQLPPYEGDIREWILESRKILGPEIIKNHGHDTKRLDGPYGLSSPTSNMFQYDVTHYDIDIALDFSGQTISGVTTVNAKSNVDNLALVDLTFTSALTIDDVSINGQPASYLQNGVLFTVYLNEPANIGEDFAVTVQYHGSPPFIGTPQNNTGGGLSFDAIYNGSICQTECEPFGSRNWFPCKDFPYDKIDSLDLRVTHPSSMTACANGLLQSINSNGDGTSTTHWKSTYPMAIYLIHFTCANQNLYEQAWEYAPGDTMPVVVYAYDGYPQAVNNYLTYTIPGLQIFSDIFGLYPFIDEKYGQTIYDLWGMENQTMVALVHYIVNEWIIIHEMAHHWWGDLITCESFHHIWLNEGFATYSEALYFEEIFGTGFYHDYIHTQSCLNEDPVYVYDLDTGYIFDGGSTYNKGSRVLHMLRSIVGDSAMFQILRNYQSDPDLRYGTAVTDDFVAHAEAVYGDDLEWFFNAWVYQYGNPHYEYGWTNYNNGNGDKVVLYIEQTQVGPQFNWNVFPMLIDIQVFYNGQDSIYKVFNSTRTQSFVLDVPQPVDSIKFDPTEWVLCTKTEAPFGMAIISNPVDTAYLGQYFEKEFNAIGGVPPYTWTHLTGQFPYGLEYTDGDPPILSGVPTWASEFSFKMGVEDSSNPPSSDTIWLTIVVTEDNGYTCGDANNDGEINVSDAVWIINYVFLNGPSPDPIESGEVNCDGDVNVSDAVWLINWVFANGPAPCDC